MVVGDDGSNGCGSVCGDVAGGMIVLNNVGDDDGW